MSTTVGAVAGRFTGYAAFDLVSLVWEYVDPNSNYNRLNRLEPKVRELVKNSNSRLDAYKNATDAFVRGLSDVHNEMVNLRRRMKESANTFLSEPSLV